MGFVSIDVGPFPLIFCSLFVSVDDAVVVSGGSGDEGSGGGGCRCHSAP